MPVLWPPSSPLFGGAKGPKKLRPYAATLYWDVFDETVAAGSVDGTDSTSESALREVADTGLNLYLDGDELVLDGVALGYDPAIYYTTLAAGAWTMWNGYALLWAFTADGNGGEFVFAPTTPLLWGGDTHPSFSYAAGEVSLGTDTIISGLTDGETYQIMLVRRPDSAGYFILFRNGSNPWRLAWMTRWTPA